MFNIGSVSSSSGMLQRDPSRSQWNPDVCSSFRIMAERKHIHDGYLLILWGYVMICSCCFCKPCSARQALVSCLKPFQQAPDDEVAGHRSDLCSMYQCLRKGSRMGQSLTIAGGICNSAVAICVTIVVWCFFVCFAFDDWSGGVSVFFVPNCLWPKTQFTKVGFLSAW